MALVFQCRKFSGNIWKSKIRGTVKCFFFQIVAYPYMNIAM